MSHVDILPLGAQIPKRLTSQAHPTPNTLLSMIDLKIEVLMATFSTILESYILMICSSVQEQGYVVFIILIHMGLGWDEEIGHCWLDEDAPNGPIFLIFFAHRHH